MNKLFSNLQAIYLKRFTLWLALAFVGFASITYVVNANRGIYADDDNMWFYTLTYKILDPQGFAQVEDRLIEVFKADDSTSAMMDRLYDKQAYTYNYLYSSVLWAIARLSVEAFSPDKSFAETLPDSVVYGFHLAFIVTLMLVMILFLRLKLPATYWLALAWSAAFACLMTFMATPKPPSFMIMNYGFLGWLQNFIWFTSDPSFSFSAFSFVGRNNYALYALAFIIARWRGNFSLFYILCALGLVMHASMAILAFLTFIIIDSLCRPHIFKNVKVILSIICALIYYFTVETLWQKVGYAALALFIPVCALIFAGMLQEKILSIQPRWKSFIENFQGRAAQNIMGWDILIFITGWLITIIPVKLIGGYVDSTQFIYFWSQLHIRVWAVWQPALIFALCFCILNGDKRENSPLSFVRAFVALIIVGILCISSFNYLWSSKAIGLYPVRMHATALELERLEGGELFLKDFSYKLPEKCYFPESLVWYVASKDYALNDGSLEKYLSRRPKDAYLDCARQN